MSQARQQLIAAGLGIAVLSGAGAAAANAPRLAEVEWAPTGITFQLQAPGVFVLTVTGPYFDAQTRGTGSLAFDCVDREGRLLPDGVYKYELREIVTSPEIEAWEAEPDPDRRDAMRWRMVREGQWPAKPRVQHNVFHIEAGRVVAPRPRPTEDQEESRAHGDEHDHPQ